MGGGVRPRFKTKKVLVWLMEQLTYANQHRDLVRAEIRAEKRRKKHDHDKARKRRARSQSFDDKDDDDSSASPAYDGIGEDRHTFRELGREQPGVLFASITSDFRAKLGRRAMDADVGVHGPVFKKWHDSCLVPS